MSAAGQEQTMRYEPSMNEHTAPRATSAGIALPGPVAAPGVGDGGEARSRKTAELDTWEDEGGATSGRATRYPGWQVDSKVDWSGERHRGELPGRWRRMLPHSQLMIDEIGLEARLLDCAQN
jgi:hypothetical protein